MWRLQDSNRPYRSVTARHGACIQLAFNPFSDDSIAAVFKDQLVVWTEHSKPRVHAFDGEPSEVIRLHWAAGSTGSLFVFFADGQFLCFDTGDWLEYDHRQVEINEEGERRVIEDEKSIIAGETSNVAPPPSRQHFPFAIKEVLLPRPALFIALKSDDNDLVLYQFGKDSGSLHDVWSLHCESAVDALTIRDHNGQVEVVYSSAGVFHAHAVPSEIADMMQCSSNVSGQSRSGRAPTRPGTMSTERLRYPVAQVEQSIVARRSSSKRHAQPKLHEYSDHRAITSEFDTPPTQSMTSSLELPRSDKAGDEASMPFLSPSIPARRSSTHLMPQIDESLQLDPLARASFETLDSSAAHDSDSDDEAYPSNATNKERILPKENNVPLPRTCGAQFSRCGKLLVFMPFRAKPAAEIVEQDIGEPAAAEDKFSELSRIFPAFGNIKSVRVNRSGAASIDRAPFIGSLSYDSNLARQLSSFDSRVSWKTRFANSAVPASGVQACPKVMLRVHQLEQSAIHYQIFQKPGEHFHDVCEHNAGSASRAGMPDYADLLRTLALIFQVHRNSVPTRQVEVGPAYRKSITSATHGFHAARNPGQSSSFDVRADWLNHPFGSAWAIGNMLQWIEIQGDVQLLANTSALLLASNDTKLANDVRSVVPHGILPPGLVFDPSSPVASTNAKSPAVPALLPRLESRRGPHQESPTKTFGSMTSSRNPSQPTTPYLDSSASSPPLNFSPFSRQGPRLSASGSVSPEHNRSSFSAAVRSYAQSITDKFPVYSSSPPFKKAGTSPNGELSSSLPIGSWSKSVSFASTTKNAAEARRGSNWTQDEPERDDDQDGDSSFVAHTSSYRATVTLSHKNRGSFYDESQQGLSLQVLPSELKSKCAIWCGSYAEMLRAQHMPIEAAELEKLSSAGPGTLLGDKKPFYQTIARKGSTREASLCNVCYTVISGAKQFCSDCLHASHPTCFGLVLADANSAGFRCPTGCGCNCTVNSGKEPQESDAISSHMTPAGGPITFSKRVSFSEHSRLSEVTA
jgi:hypothetical protein